VERGERGVSGGSLAFVAKAVRSDARLASGAHTMASASLSSAVAVAVLAAVSVASATDPLEQSRSLRADPCVRLLNNTASIG